MIYINTHTHTLPHNKIVCKFKLIVAHLLLPLFAFRLVNNGQSARAVLIERINTIRGSLSQSISSSSTSTWLQSTLFHDGQPTPFF